MCSAVCRRRRCRRGTRACRDCIGMDTCWLLALKVRSNPNPLAWHGVRVDLDSYGGDGARKRDLCRWCHLPRFRETIGCGTGEASAVSEAATFCLAGASGTKRTGLLPWVMTLKHTPGADVGCARGLAISFPHPGECWIPVRLAPPVDPPPTFSTGFRARGKSPINTGLRAQNLCTSRSRPSAEIRSLRPSFSKPLDFADLVRFRKRLRLRLISRGPLHFSKDHLGNREQRESNTAR